MSPKRISAPFPLIPSRRSFQVSRGQLASQPEPLGAGLPGPGGRSGAVPGARRAPRCPPGRGRAPARPSPSAGARRRRGSPGAAPGPSGRHDGAAARTAVPASAPAAARAGRSAHGQANFRIARHIDCPHEIAGTADSSGAWLVRSRRRTSCCYKCGNLRVASTDALALESGCGDVAASA